jgi:hypothetical protein
LQPFWSSVAKPVLDALSPSLIVACHGGDGPDLSGELAEYCREHKVIAHLLDAGASDVAANADWVVHLDAALVDASGSGDSLHETLRSIAARAAEAGRPFPPVLLHDNPRSGDGEGLHGPAQDAVAMFLSETGARLDLASIPGWSGVGILAPTTALQEGGELFETILGADEQPSTNGTSPRSADEPDGLAARVAELERALAEAQAAVRAAEESSRELGARLRGRETELAHAQDDLQALADAGEQLAREVAVARRTSHPEDATSPEASVDEHPPEPDHEPSVAMLRLTLARATAALTSATQERETLLRQLREADERLRLAAERERTLEHRSRQLESDLALLRTETERQSEYVRQLLEERELASAYARQIAESTSWRYGHRLVRFARTITFRRSVKTTSAVDLLQGTLDAPPALNPGSDSQ